MTKKSAAVAKYVPGQAVTVGAVVKFVWEGQNVWETTRFNCVITGRTTMFKNHKLWEIEFASGFSKFSDELLLEAQ